MATMKTTATMVEEEAQGEYDDSFARAARKAEATVASRSKFDIDDLRLWFEQEAARRKGQRTQGPKGNP